MLPLHPGITASPGKSTVKVIREPMTDPMSASHAATAAGAGGPHHRDALPFKQWPADPHYGRASLGKIGLWWFLLSDALMFAGLLLAYGILRGGSDVWRQPGQPLYGINFTAGLTFLLI